MNYKPFSQFLIRTPLLSFDNIKNLQEDEEYLSKIWTDNKHIREAIYIASPTLHKELSKLFKNKIDNEKEKSRLLLSFVKYFTRMSTRCTPFGLFAGCAVGNFDENTNIELVNSYNRKTRLDMYYLYKLYDMLLTIPEIRSTIKYFPNTSLYKIGKKYRYIEYKNIKLKRKHNIVEVESSSYLKKIISITHKGLNKDNLVSDLVNSGIDKENASSYIDELIDSQIIVGELFQAITGGDFLERLINLINELQCSHPILPILQNIQESLIRLDSTNGEKTDIYNNIINQLNKINLPYEENYLFQVDMVKKVSHISLANNIIDELKSTMTFLNKITPRGKNERIEQFQKDFYTRYEEAEVPLLEVLDTELGIGYPSGIGNADISPLLMDFFLPVQNRQTSITLNAFQHLLLTKTIECLSKNEREIIFYDDDIKNFTNEWDDLPPTLYTVFETISSSPNKTSLKLNFFGGSSGANLLARFAHTDDSILQMVKSITQKEEELLPNFILGEIAHVPESRTGNILARPHLHKYEIAFMSHSDLPKEQLLFLSDLMLSVRNGNLVTRSKTLNKFIIPRLTNAHNFHNSTIPVYRFLCDFQHPNGRNGLFFNWGELESLFTFRPRVRYRQTILSPATWVVKKDEIKHLFPNKDNKISLSDIKEWRNNLSIPRYVLLSDGDNKLFVDWENELIILSLFLTIKSRDVMTFVEFIFDSDQAVAKNENYSFLNECIAVFHKE